MQKLLLPVLAVCGAALLGGCVYDEGYDTGYYSGRPAYHDSGYVRRDVVHERRPYYYDGRTRYSDYDRSRSSSHSYFAYDNRRDDHDRRDRRDDDDRHKHHDRNKDRDKDDDRKKDRDRSSDTRGRLVVGNHYRERTYVKDDDKKDKKKKKKDD